MLTFTVKHGVRAKRMQDERSDVNFSVWPSLEKLPASVAAVHNSCHKSLTSRLLNSAWQIW
jgi:uncharacterized protein YbdZ (MbtH family)